MQAKVKQSLNAYHTGINTLRTADKFFRTFGSREPWGGHQYRLNRVVSLQTLKNFEKKYRIRLPKEYVEFLSEIGNGGMGPAYGLIPLLKSVKGIPKKEICSVFLPGNNEAIRIMEARADQEISGLPEWERETVRIDRAGYLNLADYGCGEYAILILTGEQKGKVWYRYEDKAHPMFISRKGKLSVLNFRDWYMHWLNESVQHLTTQPNG